MYNETPHSEATMKQPERYIEDDLKVLAEIDNQIMELLDQRAYRVQTIKEQQERNSMIIRERDDWYEGRVRGNPVAEQGMDMPMPERPAYNGR